MIFLTASVIQNCFPKYKVKSMEVCIIIKASPKVEVKSKYGGIGVIQIVAGVA